VYDADGDFEQRCNLELVDLEPLCELDERELKELVKEHLNRTGSLVAKHLFADWADALARFVKVMPRDYARALAERAAAEGKPEVLA
jgi:glutamate synthase domain-containing protein 3